nr:sodium/potassium-transporting ATPase subunit beta-1-like [Onthophagus taurus]
MNFTSHTDTTFSHPNPHANHPNPGGQKTNKHRTKQKLENIGKFIYNKKEHTVCLRTFQNWVILITYYLIFLSILMVLFAGLLSVILQTLMKNKSEPLFPKTDLMGDLSPALTIYPRIPTDSGLLIYYTRKADSQKNIIHTEKYTELIHNFLKPYDKHESKIHVNCEKHPIKEGQYCLFNKSDLGPCGNSSSDYGFREYNPCVYLKLNMIEDWKPSRKRKKTFQFQERNERFSGTSNETNLSNMIGVYCEGLTYFDEEHMGKVIYYPFNGFREYFFPYDGSDDYLRPIIGVQFKNITRGLLIGIKCKIIDIENMKDPIQHSVIFYIYLNHENAE